MFSWAGLGSLSTRTEKTPARLYITIGFTGSLLDLRNQNKTNSRHFVKQPFLCFALLSFAAAATLLPKWPGACFIKFYGSVNLRIRSYWLILTVNLLIMCHNSVIYGHFAVNYKEKCFMEEAGKSDLYLHLP